MERKFWFKFVLDAVQFNTKSVPRMSSRNAEALQRFGIDTDDIGTIFFHVLRVGRFNIIDTFKLRTKLQRPLCICLKLFNVGSEVELGPFAHPEEHHPCPNKMVYVVASLVSNFSIPSEFSFSSIWSAVESRKYWNKRIIRVLSTTHTHWCYSPP